MKQMKLTKIFLFLPFFLASQIFAQNIEVTISGTIINSESKEPVPFVNLILENESNNAFVIGVLGNEQGDFIFSNIKPGNYIAKIAVLGYETKVVPIYVGSLSEFLNLSRIKS